MIIRIIFLAFLFSFASTCDVDAGWKYVASMPNARYGHDAVLGKDGNIYVMGGQVYNNELIRKYNHGEFSNLVYEPGINTWTILEPVPGWVITGDLYDVLDPETHEWLRVQKLSNKENYYKITHPQDRKGQELAISPENNFRTANMQRQGDGVAISLGKDGRIYWIGGNGMWGGFGENIVLPYDPVKREWPVVTSERVNYSPYSYGDETVYHTEVPPMNDRRIDHEAVVTSDGKIFVMGGRYEQVKEVVRNQKEGTGEIIALDSIECYDPTTNKWEFRKPMPHKRFLFAAVVGADDKIYVFGGGDVYDKNTKSRKIYDTTEVYDPKTDTWSYRAPMPERRFAHAGVLAADGKIYILGGSLGQNDSPPLKDVFIYDPVKDSWQKGPSMLLPRASLAAVATPEGKIYAIGGTDAGAYRLKQTINYFLPTKKQAYDGKVQETVEVFDINDK